MSDSQADPDLPTDTLPAEIAERLANMSEHDELVMLRKAVQAANNVVLLTDPNLPDNPIVYLNQGFEALTGYSRSEALGRNCRFLQGDDREQGGVHQLRAAIAAREAVRVELRNYRKDGTMFWNELYVTPVFEGERLEYFLGVQNDITRRKEAELSQGLLLQAVEHASEAVVVTDAQLELPGPRIEYVNRAFTTMTGFTSEDVLGQTPRLFQGPKSDRTVLRRMRQRLAKGKRFEGETINYRKDGTPFILAWNVSPIYNPEGSVTHYVSTQQDVTERRRLERETLDISAREQRRIAGDLHDALQQQLVGTAMHAKLHARTLAGRGDDQAEQAQQLYDLMQEGVLGLRTVVQGVVPVQPSENGLMVALESLTTQLDTLYNVHCSFHYETPIRLSNFELATQLYYIAQEAASNAAKHAAATTIEIELARTDGRVALVIRDDGQGFSAESDGAHASGGMGLRLMAYRARLVGAELEVSSKPNHGTTVTCTFNAA